MRHSAVMFIICGAACGLGAWISVERGIGSASQPQTSAWEGGVSDWAPRALPGPIRIASPDAPSPPVSPAPPALSFMLGPEIAGARSAPRRSGRAAETPVAPTAFLSPLIPAAWLDPLRDDLCGAASTCVLPLALVASGGGAGGGAGRTRADGPGGNGAPRAALSAGSSGSGGVAGGGSLLGAGGDGAGFAILSPSTGGEPAPSESGGGPAPSESAGGPAPLTAGGDGASYARDDAIAVAAVPSPRSAVLLGSALALLALIFGRPRAPLARPADAA